MSSPSISLSLSASSLSFPHPFPTAGQPFVRDMFVGIFVWHTNLRNKGVWLVASAGWPVGHSAGRPACCYVLCTCSWCSFPMFPWTFATYFERVLVETLVTAYKTAPSGGILLLLGRPAGRLVGQSVVRPSGGYVLAPGPRRVCMLLVLMYCPHEAQLVFALL